MTLSVAVVFPWKDLLASLPDALQHAIRDVPDLAPKPSVLLATDSRWSWRDGGTDDGSVKLVRVAPNSIGVYAGDTTIGPRVIGQLTEQFKSTVVRPVDLQVNMRNVVNSVWSERSQSDSRLQLLVGLHDQESGPMLLRVDSSLSLEAQWVSGVQSIGASHARVEFHGGLRQEVQEQIAKMAAHGFDFTWQTWLMVVAGVVRTICRRGTESTVGGPILCGAVTELGTHPRTRPLGNRCEWRRGH